MFIIDCSVAVCNTEHCCGKLVWTARGGSNSSNAAGVLPTAVAIPCCSCCWHTLWGCPPASTSTCKLLHVVVIVIIHLCEGGHNTIKFNTFPWILSQC